MNTQLSEMLDALHEDGVVHDRAQEQRARKRRNLEPVTAELLALVVRILMAREVVEIGTANGYSTVWLADAVAETGGRLVSVDVAPSDAAQVNLLRASAVQPELADRVVLRQLDGGAYLEQLADGSVDLLFLDAERSEYVRWWPHPVRVLRDGGVLAIDNVRSHADEVAPFLALLSHAVTVVTTTVDVGKGLYLAWRR